MGEALSRRVRWRRWLALALATSGMLAGCKSGGCDSSAPSETKHPATNVASSGGAAARADLPGALGAVPASGGQQTNTGSGGNSTRGPDTSGGATGLAAGAAPAVRAEAVDALPLDFDLVDRAFRASWLRWSWINAQIGSDIQDFLALYADDATWTVDDRDGGEPKTERVVEVAQARLKGDEGRPSKAWSWQPIEQTAAPSSGFTLSTALCFRKAGDSLGCRLAQLDVSPDAQGAPRIQRERWQSLMPDEQLPKPTLTLSSRLLQLTLLKVPCAIDPRRDWEYCQMVAFLTADGPRIVSGGGGNYTATDPHDEFVRDDDHTLTWLSIGSGEKQRLRIRRSDARIAFESQFIDLEEPTRVTEWELHVEVRLPSSQPVPIYCATTEERVQHRCLPEVSGI